MGKLEGRKVIVTGGGGGFGEGIVRRFTAEGAAVAVCDIREDAAARVAEAAGPGAFAVAMDVGDRGSVEDGVRRIRDRLGDLDVVVNNAGIAHTNGALSDVGEDVFDRLVRINVKSIYLMTLATVDVFKAKGRGIYVNVGSTAGTRPRPGLTWYNGTKGFVNTVSKSMAVELAPFGIRVNAILPVLGETGLLEAFMGVPDTPENRARFIATIPLGRLSRPEDIARAALYLASDDSDFVTGALLPVDGGRTI